MNNELLDINIQSKKFGERTIIDKLNLSVKTSEIVSLVGASGCGKSTLLRLISGLDRSYKGDVSIDGNPPQLHSSSVGFIFQEPRLLSWLTVAENIGFEAGRAGKSSPLVKELLEEVGLTGYEAAYPKELSGGMAQRVAIARGLFTNPKLLLLDEPFSAVDAFTKMKLQDLLLSIAARHKTTLLLVTHDVQEAVYLSDRVVVLGSTPGRVLGEVQIHSARPRDRKDALLSDKQAQVLRLLNHEFTDYLDITQEVDQINTQKRQLSISRFNFAI